MIVSRVGRTIERLFELARSGTSLPSGAGLEAMVRDDRALLGEALDVLGFLLQEATAG